MWDKVVVSEENDPVLRKLKCAVSRRDHAIGFVRCGRDTADISDDVSFRFAYDEAIRALRGQADALDGFRQRAGTVLATTLVITSFFGGQALARGATPNSTGWAAAVAFALAGMLSVSVLFPADLTFSTDIEAVVALVERVSPDGEPYRELALVLSNQYRRARCPVLLDRKRAGAPDLRRMETSGLGVRLDKSPWRNS